MKLPCTGAALIIGAASFLLPMRCPAQERARINFEQQIAPILQKHCVGCHSPNIKKGEVSLATAKDLRQLGYIVPGDPDASYLLELVTQVDDGPAEMPREGQPLSQEQVTLIRKWIVQGGEWPEALVLRESSKADNSWWSLQPIRPPTFDAALEPEQRRGEPLSRQIDALVKSQLEQRGLSLRERADRRTLIRRATYDLLGLPPSPEQVAEFVADKSPDAFSKLVNRLLESPHYGQRWGRHWLDVVRFGESLGFERNVINNDIWPFRDYVIRSMNDDKPFDQFIREHIAGDVIAPDDPAVAIGSAFLVAGPYDDVGNQDAVQAAQIRANTIDEMIRATSEAFLGITLGCARCHDHKFDPLLQKDYYAFYATFAGVRHGAVPLATPEAKLARRETMEPLESERNQLEEQRDTLNASILQRAVDKLDAYESHWTRSAVSRLGTEDHFEPTTVRWVRLVCEAQDRNLASRTGFHLDEFEIWSSGKEGHQAPVNVALSSRGAVASGAARRIEDFPDAYGPHLAIDGKTGARFIAAESTLTIELAKPTTIDRTVFSTRPVDASQDQPESAFLAEYRIEVSSDGQEWHTVASSADRQPINQAARDRRLLASETTASETNELKSLRKQLAALKQKIAAVKPLPKAWIGTRVASDAAGPFHTFIGGSPQRLGDPVRLTSLTALAPDSPDDAPVPHSDFHYQLSDDTPEDARRLALAQWITHPSNPLTPRVLANRIWHYHFGIGIVNTPSDFGYMGGRPTHPQLLDLLASQLIESDWKIKHLHRSIMNSQVYQQSAEYDTGAAKIDADSRYLWRFPPRRLSAEEIRDTLLTISGQLATWPPKIKLESPVITDSGPGFRLYKFMQDNVSTYEPLEKHGPETYRRAIFHQNARASVVDLMTDFDQPDCTFAAPRRAATTTPLQALTMFNHSFTLDIANHFATRLRREAGENHSAQVRRGLLVAYQREATSQEIANSVSFVQDHGLAAWCRVIMNTSELIFVR